MINIKVNIKRLTETAIIPAYQTAGAAAVDLHADGDFKIEMHPIKVSTGLAIEIPPGYCGVLLPRSGQGHRDGFMLGNTAGLIDSDYRGEILVSLYRRNAAGSIHNIYHGDRIAQMVFLPVSQAIFREVGELNETKRGDGGFGHTGVTVDGC